MDNQPIIIKQQPNWITIAAVVLAIIFAFLFFRGCKGKDTTTIIKIADSALIEENRRLLEQTTIDKQYKWKTDLLLTQREELEGVIVDLTKQLQTREGRIRKIIVTDTASCIELANQVNDYIDTAIKYRSLVDEQQAGYETAIMYEQLHSESLRRLLDSCRAVIGIVQPAFKALKPRGVVSVGIVGGWSPIQYGIGPALMYRDKRGRSYQFNAQITNNQPLYQGGFFVPVRFRKL